MGEISEETQRLKRIAAAAYDYDNDSRWNDYWSNILIPPNLVSRSDVIDHFKRKFYQRYIVCSLSLSLSFNLIATTLSFLSTFFVDVFEMIEFIDTFPHFFLLCWTPFTGFSRIL